MQVLDPEPGIVIWDMRNRVEILLDVTGRP